MILATHLAFFTLGTTLGFVVAALMRAGRGE